jgi:hypothetical protein
MPQNNAVFWPQPAYLPHMTQQNMERLTQRGNEHGRLYADHGYWHTHTHPHTRSGPAVHRESADTFCNCYSDLTTLRATYRSAIHSIHDKRKVLSLIQYFLSSGHVNTTFFVYNCIIPVFIILLKGPMMNWLKPKHAANGKNIYKFCLTEDSYFTFYWATLKFTYFFN